MDEYTGVYLIDLLKSFKRSLRECLSGQFDDGDLGEDADTAGIADKTITAVDI